MPQPSSTTIRLPSREADAGLKNGTEDSVRCVKIQVTEDAFSLQRPFALNNLLHASTQQLFCFQHIPSYSHGLSLSEMSLGRIIHEKS